MRFFRPKYHFEVIRTLRRAIDDDAVLPYYFGKAKHMRKGIIALSIMTAGVAIAASFSAVTYAGFTSQADVNQPVGVKRSLYLDVGGSAWADGTSYYGAWTWPEDKSGSFAGGETFMRAVPGYSTRFRISVAQDTKYVIFVKFSSGATPAWGNMKKTESGNDKQAFQTENITLTSAWDTFTIGSLSADQYTADGYRVWSGTTSKNY